MVLQADGQIKKEPLQTSKTSSSLLKKNIRKVFLTNLTGQNAFSDTERELLALPDRLGGLGIFDPTKKSTLHYSTCETISAPLVHLILRPVRGICT